LDGIKNTTGYTFMLGSTTISWKSKFKGKVSLSTTKAKYTTISEAANTSGKRGFYDDVL